MNRNRFRDLLADALGAVMIFALLALFLTVTP
jgi:hypothetical protein